MEKKKPRAIGFIYKNTAGNRPLDSYVNSIDQVERIMGLDFFSELPDEIENRVEKECDLNEWKFFLKQNSYISLLYNIKSIILKC